jgi:hypothetical protein
MKSKKAIQRHTVEILITLVVVILAISLMIKFDVIHKLEIFLPNFNSSVERTGTNPSAETPSTENPSTGYVPEVVENTDFKEKVLNLEPGKSIILENVRSKFSVLEDFGDKPLDFAVSLDSSGKGYIVSIIMPLKDPRKLDCSLWWPGKLLSKDNLHPFFSETINQYCGL